MKILLFAATALSFFLAASFAEKADSAKSWDKREDSTDVMQTDPRGEFGEAGGNYCGPASAANGLAWLGLNGFPKLLPGDAEEPVDIRALRLTKELAQEELMNSGDGTSVEEMRRGLARYVAEKDYDLARSVYTGWRPFGFPGATKGAPNLALFAEGAAPSAAMFINMGWYKVEGDTLVRVGGHWAVVVAVSPEEVYVIDPSPRTGKEKAAHPLGLTPLDENLTLRDSKDREFPAKGFHALSEDYPSSKRAEIAILDGIVLFELK